MAAGRVELVRGRADGAFVGGDLELGVRTGDERAALEQTHIPGGGGNVGVLVVVERVALQHRTVAAQFAVTAQVDVFVGAAVHLVGRGKGGNSIVRSLDGLGHLGHQRAAAGRGRAGRRQRRHRRGRGDSRRRRLRGVRALRRGRRRPDTGHRKYQRA